MNDSNNVPQSHARGTLKLDCQIYCNCVQKQGIKKCHPSSKLFKTSCRECQTTRFCMGEMWNSNEC